MRPNFAPSALAVALNREQMNITIGPPRYCVLSGPGRFHFPPPVLAGGLTMRPPETMPVVMATKTAGTRATNRKPISMPHRRPRRRLRGVLISTKTLYHIHPRGHPLIKTGYLIGGNNGRVPDYIPEMTFVCATLN